MEIVDLAIEDDLVAIEIAHRLMAERGEVDDREAAVAEADFLVRRDIGAAINRAEVMDSVIHHLYFLRDDFL